MLSSHRDGHAGSYASRGPAGLPVNRSERALGNCRTLRPSWPAQIGSRRQVR
jgi:hypothetical protein